MIHRLSDVAELSLSRSGSVLRLLERKAIVPVSQGNEGMHREEEFRVRVSSLN